MFLRRNKALTVKKNLDKYESIEAKDPLRKHTSLKQSEFTKSDIPEENAKSVRKLILLAFALVMFWFLRECWLSWNIFS